jgi:hypothetical protein
VRRAGLFAALLGLWVAMGQKEVVNLAGDPGEGDTGLLELLQVKRVHVEKLAGGDSAIGIREMLIGGLQNSRLFQITENPDRADAVLRGWAEDLIFTDTFSTSEGMSARTFIGSQRSAGTTRSGGGVSVGEQESVRIAERKHEAVAAVRLVNKEGDVIWSTTQESLGAKFRGSSADVADKVVKRLVEDFARARKLRSRSEPASVSK